MSTKTTLPAIEGGPKIRDQFLVFAKPKVDDKAIAGVVESLQSGWIGAGPKVKEFEEKLRKHIETPHAKAVNSCTAALHLAVRALGITEGDEVIVPSYTFCATANSVLFERATPVLVDVDYDTFNLDIDAVKAAITPKTKAIIPVHLAGHPVDMDKILAIAKQYGLYVIEDSAHSIEGKYKGKVTGSIGDIGCYSFYATKNLTTGEGGLIVWNDDKFTEQINESGLHGLSADAWKRFSESGFKHYEASRLGFKYNMTDIQAALGLAHLDDIYDYLKVRENIWSYYSKEIKARKLPAKPPTEIDPSWTDSIHARHLYIIRLELDKLRVNRDHILNALQAEGIGCGVHYKPLHLHKFYKETLDINAAKLMNATRLADEILSIPIAQGMSEQDASDVIEALDKVLSYYRA